MSLRSSHTDKKKMLRRTTNPFHAHCGPGNKVAKLKPNNAIDAACWKHDIAYGTLQKQHGHWFPYLNHNDADVEFLKDMAKITKSSKHSRKTRAAAKSYASFFKLKKSTFATGTTLGKPKTPKRTIHSFFQPSAKRRKTKIPETLPSNVPLRDTGEETAVSSHTVNAMPKRRRSYRKKGRGRRGKRSRFSRSRSRKPRRRKTSRYVKRNRLVDLLAPPRTHKIAWSQIITNPTTSNKSTLFTAPALNDEWSMRSLIQATGEDDEVFGDVSLNAQMNIVFSSQFHRIRNNTDTPCYLSAWLVTPKYDLHDCDVTENLITTVSNTAMDRIANYMKAFLDATDDADISNVSADGGNDRHLAYIVMPQHQDFVNRNFLEAFRVLKRYKTRKLDYGDTTTYKLVDKRTKKILPEIHTLTGANVTPQAFAGRTKFFLFKVWGPLVGTAEVAGASEDNLKVASGYYQLHHEMIQTQTLKALQPYTALHEMTDLRPTITAANEIQLVDEDMALDGQEFND